MIAIDTNLLVYAHRRQVPEHRAARRAIERAAVSGAGWGLALPTVAEFWSVTTHSALPRPSTPAEARAFLTALVRDGHAQLWLPDSGFAERLVHRAAELGVSGPRIFDLQIALIALRHGAREIWTHDAGFLRVPGLAVRDPLEERASPPGS